MRKLTASALRGALSETLNQVAFGGERVVIHRHDKDVAVLISTRDYARLLEFEKAANLDEARKAMAESSGDVGWEEVKAERGPKSGL